MGRQVLQQYIVDAGLQLSVQIELVRLNQEDCVQTSITMCGCFSDSDNITNLRTWAVNSSCCYLPGDSRICVRASRTPWLLDADMVHQMAFLTMTAHANWPEVLAA